MGRPRSNCVAALVAASQANVLASGRFVGTFEAGSDDDGSDEGLPAFYEDPRRAARDRAGSVCRASLQAWLASDEGAAWLMAERARLEDPDAGAAPGPAVAATTSSEPAASRETVTNRETAKSRGTATGRAKRAAKGAAARS